MVLTQVSAVEVLELAALPHVSVCALAVVQDRVGDLHREARRAVQAVPVGRVTYLLFFTQFTKYMLPIELIDLLCTIAWMTYHAA